MEERFEDVLAVCMVLFGRLMGYDGAERGHGRVIIRHVQVTNDAGTTIVVRVGASDSDQAGAKFFIGEGVTMAAAARDWRERMVAEARSRIVEHESIKAFLDARGLLR